MHWYRDAKTFSVTLTTTWHATYTLNNGPVVDVADEISPPSNAFNVTVQEARTVLYN